MCSSDLLLNQEEESRDRFSEATRLIELYDHPAAAAALDDFERGAFSPADQLARKEQAAELRKRLAAQSAEEQRLRLEALALAERQKRGPALADVAETHRRAAEYLDAFNQVGGTLKTRLKAIFADPEGLVSACRQFLDRTRNEVSLQQATLNKAMSEEQIADLAAAAEALERLRLLLRTLTEAKYKEIGRAHV